MHVVSGGMSRDDELPASQNDSTSLGAITLGFTTMVLATGAAAQGAPTDQQTVLPTMEVTAKKKTTAKKPAAQKKSQPVASAPVAPPPTPAEARANETSGFTPSSGNTLESGTGIARLPGNIQGTPQIVNVISEEQLRQQRPTTVEQALRAVPGVTVAIGEGGGGFNGDQFRIRGFEAKGDIYVDGLRDFGVYVRDSFSTQEVQVIKGPSSETFGSGSTGGIINLRQKTAHLGDDASVEFGVGTDGYFRSTLDVNKQINATTASRAVAMYHTQDQPDRDHVEGERWGVLGSIGFGLGTDTTWTVNYMHQEGNRVLDYGVPSLLKPGKTTGGLPVTEYGIDRSNFYGVATDHDDTTVNMLTSHFRKDLSDTVTFFNDTRAAFYDRDFMATVPQCANTPTATSCATQFFAGGNPNVTNGGGNPTLVQHSWGIQNITGATAQFNLFGLRHESVAGVDVFYQEDDRPGYSQYDGNGVIRGTVGAPIRDPGSYYNQYYSFGRNPVNDRSSDGTEVGLFASDRVWFNREWSVLAGARWTSFDYNFEQPNAAPTATVPIPFRSGSSTGEFWSPKASLIWEPTKSQTYYFSWGRSASPAGQFVTNILNPLTATTPAGAVEENESYEVGAKISLLDNRLGLTAALFQVEKNGVIVSDPAVPNALIQTGESQRVRGFEVGISGQLTRAWIANVGYTHLDSEVTDSTTAANIGNDVGGVPHSAVSLWTTYDLSDELINGPGKWTIGSGFIYQSQMFSIAGANSNAYIVPYTFSWDAMLSYELDDWRFAVNGFNLTDRLNYDQSFNNRATPSAGRSAVFSVSKRF
jgi:catecholate siderophore receptor